MGSSQSSLPLAVTAVVVAATLWLSSIWERERRECANERKNERREWENERQERENERQKWENEQQEWENERQKRQEQEREWEQAPYTFRKPFILVAITTSELVRFPHGIYRIGDITAATDYKESKGYAEASSDRGISMFAPLLLEEEEEAASNRAVCVAGAPLNDCRRLVAVPAGCVLIADYQTSYRVAVTKGGGAVVSHDMKVQHLSLRVAERMPIAELRDRFEESTVPCDLKTRAAAAAAAAAEVNVDMSHPLEGDEDDDCDKNGNE